MTKRIGVDLGSSFVRIITDDAPVFCAPSILIRDRDGTVIASGIAARAMVGKLPKNLEEIRPVRYGAVVDRDACSQMMQAYLEHLGLSSRLTRPDAVVAVPDSLSTMEREILREAFYRTNIRKVSFVSATLCAAVGAGLQYRDARGSLLFDAGGNLCKTAVISLGHVVSSGVLKGGGETLDAALAEYIRRNCALQIGQQTAERLKKTVGTAKFARTGAPIVVIGRDLKSRQIIRKAVTPELVLAAFERQMNAMAALVQKTLSQTPPELCADIGDYGILLCGGGALLSGFSQKLADSCRMRVTVASDPGKTVADGLRRVLMTGREEEFAL
ncbi:MAG: rod shape-determining protein [Clostridia bacterium]|nr:rod shape-determining protein [Clostridia bacterium]